MQGKVILTLLFLVFVIAGCSQPAVQNGTPQPGAGSGNTGTPQPEVGKATPTPTPATLPDEAAADGKPFEGTTAKTEKKSPASEKAIMLTAVRSARHEGFDRIVFEFSSDSLSQYTIEYVEKAENCGSGDEIPVTGSAVLSVLFRPAYAHDLDKGESTIPVADRSRSPGFPAIKDIRMTCDFEADVEWALGVAAKNKYRVLELKNPTRLVIDVEH